MGGGTSVGLVLCKVLLSVSLSLLSKGGAGPDPIYVTGDFAP